MQNPTGIIAEHKWTREHAGLFDVSHMGPSLLMLNEKSGDAERDHATIAGLVEPLVSGDIRGLKPSQMRYTLLLNDAGGTRDDLMIERPELSLADYIAAGADRITVHAEACVHLHRTVHFIKEKGLPAGVAINPATPVSVLEPILHDLDLVLRVARVRPGREAVDRGLAQLERIRVGRVALPGARDDEATAGRRRAR